MALVAVCAALWGVARTTGSGWIIVVISVAAGLAVTGAVAPALLLPRLRVTATGPGDAVAGDPAELQIDVRGPAVRLRCVEPPGEWHHVEGDDAGGLAFVPDRRGVIDCVTIDAECAAPLGIMWWRRRLRVALPAETVVGPAPLAHELPAVGAAAANDGEGLAHTAGDGDMVRGAREYRPGDPVRLLHWAASARRGKPMLKELERDPLPAVVVTVDLSGSTDDQEIAAGRAAGLCAAALAAGRPTILLTREGQTDVADNVATPLEVSRRLGRAASVPPRPVPGHLHGVEVVVVRAFDNADAPSRARQGSPA